MNSINYNCPSIHFLICALFSVFREFFVYIQHSSIRALFYISQKSLHSSLINQGIFCLSRISSIFSLIKGLLHFANILHSLFHWSGLFLHFANIIHPSFYYSGPSLHFANILHSLFHWSGLFLHFANIIHPSFCYSGPFFAFRKNHTSNFLLFRAFFCNSRKSYIHLFFFDQSLSLHVSRFIHPFLSLRINLF